MGLITVPASLTDLGQKIADELAQGRPSRHSLGTTQEAFAWTEGMPPTLANYIGATPVSGMRFDFVTVSPSATPAAKVAEKAAKPVAVSFVPGTKTLSKYAGQGTWTLEADLSAEALAAAVYQVIAGQCLMALEADILDVLDAGAAIDIPGTATDTWPALLLAAQAAILGAGGRPGVIVVSPTDYAEMMTTGGESGGFAMFNDPEAGPLGRLLFGSAVHVSPALEAGTAYVLDPAAVLVGENENSPVVIANPYTSASTNEIQLVVDLIAAAAVVQPGAVAQIVKASA